MIFCNIWGFSIFNSVRLIIWFLELRFYECCQSCFFVNNIMPLYEIIVFVNFSMGFYNFYIFAKQHYEKLANKIVPLTNTVYHHYCVYLKYNYLYGQSVVLINIQTRFVIMKSYDFLNRKKRKDYWFLVNRYTSLNNHFLILKANELTEKKHFST